MTYENSPACRLIATHCCVCGRDLVDSVSVEAGIGPVCREKYGYTEAQLEPDWNAYRELMSGGSHANGWMESTDSPRHRANVITHRIAADITAPTVRRDILTLSALGFSTLSETLAERVSRALVLEIESTSGVLILRTPYDPRLVERLRAVRGRRWDPEQKVNTFPKASEADLLRALKAVYPADTFVVRDRRVVALGEELAEQLELTARRGHV